MSIFGNNSNNGNNGNNGNNMNNMNNQNNTVQCNNGVDQNGNPCTQQNTGWRSYLPNMWPFNGGRKRTVKRGGGVRGYTDQNVASTASRFSGGQTAQPHQWTGGKRRRRTKSKRRSFKCNKCSKRKRHKH
jgi:hypothetical protein